MGKTRDTAFDRALRLGHEVMRTDASVPCRGRTDIFFPDRAKPGALQLVELAKRLCAGCDVATRLACKAGAQLRQEPDGVWGGVDCFERYNPAAKSSREWARKQRERQRAARTPTTTDACGTVAGHRRHYLANEPPCEPCREANIEYAREWRRRQATG